MTLPGKRVGIIGAGPAGLTAGYLLAKDGYEVTIFEADPIYVGGISRTVVYKDYHFDIGGHRFFSKSQQVEDFWTEIMGDGMLQRPRSSRIFYRGKFFDYPLKPFDALFKLGIIESFVCILSYVKARLLPIKNPTNFEDWVSNKFGQRLYRIFFKTYTEKVWGMSCRDISADWAAQRIKGLSLTTVILSAFKRKKPIDRTHIIKTLVETFRYPKYGPGQLWSKVRDRIQEKGSQIIMGAWVNGLKRENGEWQLSYTTPTGDVTLPFDYIISSTNIRHLTKILPDVRSRPHADALKYRDFITVGLITKDLGLFQDNWIYIHLPEVKVGRIQNFKSWSPFMVPAPHMNAYGLEYFCFEGDGLWTMPDKDLIALAAEEMHTIGLIQSPNDVEDALVIRQPKAYPVYDDHYAAHVEVIRTELEQLYPTLHLIGRNGMHKYNNQDHAMMTAMLTVNNIKAGERLYDIWQVNQDAEYHEEGETSSGLRAVPMKR